jgi:hypothetical protein
MATWGQIRLELLTFAKANGSVSIPFHVLNNAINTAYEKILSARRWRGLNVESTVAVDGPITAGTVAIARGATTVTLTGAAWSLAANGRKFRITGQRVWYVLTWNSATAGELDRPFEDETQTAASYSLFQDEYEVPADCGVLLKVKDVRTGYPLTKVDPDWITANNPSLMQLSDPVAWAPATSTTQSDVKRVAFYPVPIRPLSLQVKYKLITVGFDGSNDGDGPLAWVSAPAIQFFAKSIIARDHVKNVGLAREQLAEYASSLADMHREEMQEQSVGSLAIDRHYTRRSL